MISKLRFSLFSMFIFMAFRSYSQAPSISYSSPQTYFAQTAITPLTPANGGGAVGTSSTVTISSAFNNPRGVATDPSGNIYVADNGNSAIKMIPKGGGTIISLGSGFNHPVGVVTDNSGNVYITDSGNSAVKEIMAGGTIVTLGSGFVLPYGIALDASGNVYVSDATNNSVSKISAGVSTPVVLAAGFSTPTGIAVDQAGNVYVADRGTNSIKEIPVGGGSVITVVTGGLNAPNGVAIDNAGNMYIDDDGNNQVKRIPAGGGPVVIMGSGLSLPTALAVDAAANVYVSDGGSASVKEVTTGGYYIKPALPAGLSINNATGIITGTPGAVSSATNYTITSYNNAGSSTATLNIAVTNPPPPVISYNSPKVYTATEAISPLSPTSTGGAIPPTGAFSITPTLPTGLSFDINTGIISGTPTSASVSTNYKIKATNLGGNNTATLNITVNLPPAPIVSYGSGPLVFTAGAPITSFSPTNSGGPVSSSGGYLISPSLPSGLNFDTNTGTISGTPTSASASTNYTVTASNIGGSGTTILNITVNLPPVPSISYSTPQVYTALTTISSLSPINTGGQVQSAGGYLITPLLPSGLSFNTTTGVITGTPTTASPATNYTITATNLGGSGTATLNITVNPYPVPVISYNSPKNYPLNVAISPLSPSSTGVGAAGSSITALGTGFNNLTGVAVDAAGNVYVAENGNNDIREIQTNGTVITIGSGFSQPTGVAVDASGNVFVADNGNNAVKKIPAGNGAVTTIATGFNGPYGIALDAAGNIYVGDASNNVVKKIPSGTNTPIIIGSGFNHPTGVAVDAAGNVYVADRANNAIKKILASNGATITLGSGNGNPNGVAADASGNVYFADTNISSITEIPIAGGSYINIGSGFSNATALAVWISDPNVIYVGDNGNGVVKKVSPTGGYFISPALPAGLTFSSGTGTISGTPTAASPATNYTVKAYNIGGSGTATVNIAVYVPHAGLANLAVSSGTLSPAFQTSVTSYGVSEINNVSSITLTPTTSDPSYTITINGTAVSSGTASLAIPLTIGSNTISVIVKSSTGTVLGIYTVVANRAASSDANLSMLSLDNGSLSPSFAAGTTNYTAAVAFNFSSVKITPVVDVPTATVKVNGITVTSGTQSGAISLHTGSNAINVVVFAQDGTTSKTYTITVTRLNASSNANLAGLAVSSGSLTPTFVYNTLNYAVNVNNNISSITVTPTLADATASVKVNNQNAASGTASSPIQLTVGTNAVTVTVTAQDSTTTEIYHITVTRAATNATLSKLALSAGTLNPFFAPATISYSTSVGNAVSSISITPTTGDPNATLTVNGTAVTSGTASGAIPLTVGPNTITTIVTATDGITTKTYTITVTRAPSTNDNLSSIKLIPSTAITAVAGPDYKDYTASVSNAISSIQVLPTTVVSTSTVTVNGTIVISGAASAAIPLNVGANIITTAVTAEDGVSIHSYVITVTRAQSSDATLSALSLSSGTISPAFKSTIVSYLASVANTVTSLTVTPAATVNTATMTVNGTTVVSGTASAAIPLNVGPNTITTMVTAADGVTTKAYTVTVTRAPSTNDNLSSLKLTPATTLTVVSGPDYKDYTAPVNNATSSVEVTPAAVVNTSSITVNGVGVLSGSASAPIPLAVGPNTITTVVTAQDGVSTHTYVITVTRAPSANAALSSLTLSTGTLNPVFASGKTSYTASVANTVTSITATAATSDGTATVTVNGVSVTSGTASGVIALNVGSNTITTIVTAQDGVTTNTYTVTITRAPSNNANLTSLKLTNPGAVKTTVSGPDAGDYTASVSNATTSIEVIPVTTVSTSAVTVNGTAVLSGATSNPISLNVGANTITTIVTAQDGVTTKTYVITVTRAATGINIPYEAVSVSSPTDHPQMMGEEINVHTGLSPNGDGINDFLLIDGIANYPDNKLQIMNRNGVLVFEARGYDNNTKVFDGHSNKTGAMQNPGTYFYSLDYTMNGIIKHKTGFLVLKY